MTNNDLKYILGRRVDIKFSINSKRYSRVYPVDNQDVKSLIMGLAHLSEDYVINNWKVNFSDTFFIEREYVYSSDQIIDDLNININSIICMNKAMKLTK